MKAVVYEAWGGVEQLSFTDVDPIQPGDGEVRVKLNYSGVNPADAKFLSGKYRLIAQGGFPRRIGFEGSGRVVSTGPGVADLPPGAGVVVVLDPRNGRLGTVAEEITLPRGSVIPVPDNIELKEAAVLPVAAATAWRMCELGAVTAGSRVLIAGASGGVGGYAVQLAKLKGAKVTAVAGERNRDWVMGLGADHFIDYRVSRMDSLKEQWDVVLDCVNSLRPLSGKLLVRGGRYVDTDPRPLVLTLDKFRNIYGRVKRYTVMVGAETAIIQELLDMVERRTLKPMVCSEFALEQAVDAYKLSISGHAVGKIVVNTGSPFGNTGGSNP